MPTVLGGSNHIEHYLAPSFAAPGVEHAAGDGGRAMPDWQPARRASRAELRQAITASRRRTTPPKLSLMAVSSGAARWRASASRSTSSCATGRCPIVIAASFAGVHRLLLNKYYVDEIYDAAIVQPIKGLSERGLWKVVDAGIIDGAVNGAGAVVSGWSAILRRLQTGSIRAYALSILVGAVVILGYYVWR